jgi:hypothetical protein
MEFSPARSDLDGPDVIEDLLQGVNEWRNIQDIVRATFKALSDVVKTQGVTICRLERQISTIKQSADDVRADLELRATKSEVQRSLADMQFKLDPQQLRIEVESKVSRTEF